MNTPIEFQANKDQWEITPTILGWQQIILLEDTGNRIVFIGRDFGSDEEFQPFKNQQYVVLDAEADIAEFIENIANGNYNCCGLYREI
jgi:hypothetical protein|tara:strand:+ start:3805 stop:4068 length:264 start_codon:yes stop_codon:yes gene_type:complete